ncbi:MAG: TetR/AcrR family transcriptional regulator [Syntrophales bacterium]|jgi:AcrR family transcriptional regulator|nr:MAG: TetR/AcrR family transcriptional regulator [Deltaproteobacteria bacterium HGW-Deltaproteobacteria-19]
MEENTTFADLKSEAILARRELIVEAAERVFAVKPFHRVSIRDIAQEAGISHALIYRYFPDQQSIFVEAFIRGAEEIGGVIERLIDESETPDIAKISDAFLSYCIDNDQYLRMLTHFMLDGELSAEKVEKINAAERRFFDQFDRLFRKLKKPEPVRPLSHAFFAALNGVLITFRNYPGRTPEEVKQHMLNVGRMIDRGFSDSRK